MNLSIRKFNPKVMEERRKNPSAGPPTCVIIGKRGTGKTHLVTDLLYYTRKIPMGVVMSGTEESAIHYAKYIPDLFIYDDFQPEVISQIITQQRKEIKKGDKIDHSLFILLDDCMYDKKSVKSKDIRGIFMNGRHWKIFFLLTMQYCMDLPPDLRSNVDYVFLLREPVIQNRIKLYKNFFGIFPTFDAFQEVMNACTENYDCLVLDNTAKSNKIEDVVFWYKAKHPIKKFKIGSKSLWKHHKQNYNTKHEEEETPFEQKKIKRRKNEPVIIVKKIGKRKKK